MTGAATRPACCEARARPVRPFNPCGDPEHVANILSVSRPVWVLYASSDMSHDAVTRHRPHHASNGRGRTNPRPTKAQRPAGRIMGNSAQRRSFPALASPRFPPETAGAVHLGGDGLVFGRKAADDIADLCHGRMSSSPSSRYVPASQTAEHFEQIAAGSITGARYGLPPAVRARAP